MKYMDKKQLTIEPVDRIGGLFPKNKITLLTGLPGTGKSYSTIKFLNKNNIVPIYFNLDHSEIGNLESDMFDNNDLVELMNSENKYTDLENKVIVIDTYSRLESLTEKRDRELVDLLESLVETYNFTLIILAHPEDYVGRDSIFKDNTTLVRNCYEHIHLEAKITSSTKNKETTITVMHIMYVKKGRSYIGDRTVIDWMREEELPEVLK